MIVTTYQLFENEEQFNFTLVNRLPSAHKPTGSGRLFTAHFTMKNIIFDLGAVIIDIDYNLTANAFKKLGLQHFDEIYSKKKQDNFFDRFETGELSNDEFRQEVRSHFTSPITDEQIDEAWNAMLINIPFERMVWLNEIKNKYRIFLLSNTNRIHVTAFTKILADRFGVGVFEKMFEKIYYSCNIGMRKPNANIFDLVVQENKLNLTETIFIDDSPQHIEGARSYGLTALHLQNNSKVEDLVSAAAAVAAAAAGAAAAGSR